jgi:hypothetical protein
MAKARIRKATLSSRSNRGAARDNLLMPRLKQAVAAPRSRAKKAPKVKVPKAPKRA